MTKLSGVFPVVPTPFTGDGAADPAAFLRLVDFALSCGVDGLVFPGMASEVETLKPEERADLVAALGRHLAGRVPFIVGAPNGLGHDPVKHADFYAAVAAHTELPIMLQNAPAPMGAGLQPEEVAAVVKAVPAIRFVKEETLPCGQHVTRILAEAGDRLDGVFGGAGGRYVVDELARGAAGTMPAIEIADVHAALVRAWNAGDRATARRLYNVSLPLLTFQAVFRVRATKEVLRRRGLLTSTMARAAGPVPDADDIRELEALLADARSLFDIHPPHLDREAA
jgi:4-hydroxy-tetrahydrodipicolinate synthase